MWLLISNVDKLPDNISKTRQIERMTYEEFIKQATGPDGIEVDEGMYYHEMCLTKDIYNGLLDYVECDVKFIFYHFDGETPPIDKNKLKIERIVNKLYDDPTNIIAKRRKQKCH